MRTDFATIRSLSAPWANCCRTPRLKPIGPCEPREPRAAAKRRSGEAAKRPALVGGEVPNAVDLLVHLPVPQNGGFCFLFFSGWISGPNKSRGTFPILSSFFLENLRNPPKKRICWFLERTMVEKNGKSTPRRSPELRTVEAKRGE